MKIITRQNQPVAVIELENEKLIVRAASQSEADRILSLIAVPYRVGYAKETTIRGEQTNLHCARLVFPGTQEHWQGLGIGGASVQLVAPFYEIPPGWRVEEFTLPKFQFRAEYRRPPSTG